MDVFGVTDLRPCKADCIGLPMNRIHWFISCARKSNEKRLTFTVFEQFRVRRHNDFAPCQKHIYTLIRTRRFIVFANFLITAFIDRFAIFENIARGQNFTSEKTWNRTRNVIHPTLRITVKLPEGLLLLSRNILRLFSCINIEIKYPYIVRCCRKFLIRAIDRVEFCNTPTLPTCNNRFNCCLL